LDQTVAPRAHAAIKRNQVESSLCLELLVQQGFKLVLNKRQAVLHRLGGVNKQADVVLEDGAEEEARAAGEPGDAFLVLVEGGSEAGLVGAVQVGRDVDVDDGAVVPEDVGELVAVAGVDELLVRDLVKFIF